MPLKLTQRGRGIKDNSRRNGAGADRVAARRQGAAKRFKILTYNKWCVATGYGVANENYRAEYLGYLDRKQAEAKALGWQAQGAFFN